MATQIHPTAIVDEGARLGKGVVVGPNVVIEADVVVGDRCRLMAGAVLHRYTEMGPDNVVGPYCVFGGLGQDMGFDAETVKRVIAMVDGSEYKRRQSPPGVKITSRAFGRDRRLPIVNKYRQF